MLTPKPSLKKQIYTFTKQQSIKNDEAWKNLIEFSSRFKNCFHLIMKCWLDFSRGDYVQLLQERGIITRSS